MRSIAPRVGAIVIALIVAACAEPKTFAPLPATIQMWDGGRLFWTGAIQQADYRKFVALGIRPEDIRELRFRNSPGGDIEGLRNVEAMVARHDIPVHIQGYCASACALIYLTARHRVMRDDFVQQRTVLHFHGSYNRTTGDFVDRFDERELAVLEANTQGRFPKDLYIAARKAEHPRGGLYVYKWPYDGGDDTPSVFSCTGLETSIPQRCKALPEFTAVKLGLDAR